MLFKESIHKTVVFMSVLLVSGGVFVSPVVARTDRAIQKAFAGLYEDKVYALREDLIQYEVRGGDPEFFTDMHSFLYPGINKGYAERILFKKGERVLIDDVDFDKDSIVISFTHIGSEQEGEMIFEFGQRLSSAFVEKQAFTTRYDEIFLDDSLKKVSTFSDTISNLIVLKKIQIGDSKEELLLTLGDPSDIVKRVTATGSAEEWYYRDEDVFYQFFFENDELSEWVAHQER